MTFLDYDLGFFDQEIGRVGCAVNSFAAEALLKKRLGEVDSGVYVPPEDRLTFREVAKLWIDSKVRLRAASVSDYQTTLDCYLVPYFGARKYDSITRLDIEKFRAEMVVGVPESVQRARDEKLRELRLTDPNATLRALDPGPRTTNKCIGVLISIGFYAVDHDLTIKNVAQRMEKVLEDGEGEDSEESVIEENVLTPSELVRAIDAALDPYRAPIAMAAYCGLRQANLLEAGENIATVSRALGHAMYTSRSRRMRTRSRSHDTE